MNKKEREILLKKGEELCDQATQLAGTGDHSTALEIFTRSEEYFTQIQDQHWLNFSRHGKLHSLQRSGDLESALKLTEQIAAGYLETGNKHGYTLLMTHKADILLEQDKVFDALGCLRTAEAIAVTENFNDLSGYIYSSIAINLISQEDYVTAIGILEKNLKLYNSDDHLPECAWCLRQTGICYQNTCDFAEAGKYFTSSYQAYFKADKYENALEVIEQLKTLYINSGQHRKISQLENIARQKL